MRQEREMLNNYYLEMGKKNIKGLNLFKNRPPQMVGLPNPKSVSKE